METRPVLDVSGWSRFTSDNRHPMWWGILGLIVIEATVVGIFIVSYFYLRMGRPDWPPGGLEPPPLLYPTLSVVLLVLSAAAMFWAGKRIKRGDRQGLVIGIGAALLLDGAVLVFRWIQFLELDFRWSDHAYGSIVWTLTGFHFLHVVSAVIGTGVIWILALKGYYTKERQLGVVVDAMYWYFVSLVWIPLYLTLYWAPRLLPAM